MGLSERDGAEPMLLRGEPGREGEALLAGAEECTPELRTGVLPPPRTEEGRLLLRLGAL